MLRRLLLVMSVAALMAAMVAVTAVPAFATIHPLANMENSNDEHASAVAQSQDPPGLTPAELVPGGTGKSQGSPPNNPTGTTVAQPVFAVTPEGQQAPDSPPGTFGTNPSKDGASANAFK
jgi:hypothetical protein